MVCLKFEVVHPRRPYTCMIFFFFSFSRRTTSYLEINATHLIDNSTFTCSVTNSLMRRDGDAPYVVRKVAHVECAYPLCCFLLSYCKYKLIYIKLLEAHSILSIPNDLNVLRGLYLKSCRICFNFILLKTLQLLVHGSTTKLWMKVNHLNWIVLSSLLNL